MTDVTIETYLMNRYGALSKTKSELKAHLDQIDAELTSVIAAAEAIELDLKAPDSLNALIPSLGFGPQNSSGDALTMKEAAVEILREHKPGLTANEILEWMRLLYGMSYPRSSLSPQLSRLKFDGTLVLQDGKWLLSEYASQDQQLFDPNDIRDIEDDDSPFGRGFGGA